MNRIDSSLLRVALVALSIFALPACSSEDTGGEPPKDGTPAETQGTVFTCAEDDFAVLQPFGGPGYDEKQGGLLEPTQETYLASSTFFALKADEGAQQRFIDLSTAIFQQLPTQDGLIGWGIARSAQCDYLRTMTVWRDEEAMIGFVMSEAHVQAMSEASSLGSGAVTSWEISRDELPLSWDVARENVAQAKPFY